jgi:hypothetical protein
MVGSKIQFASALSGRGVMSVAWEGVSLACF